MRRAQRVEKKSSIADLLRLTSDLWNWARQDSNLGPRDYESPALTAELQARVLSNLSEIAAVLPA